MDVGQQETDEEADDPGGEHAHCELLRGVTHSVPIFYKVLTNARQTVDSRPAEIEIRCLIVFEAGDFETLVPWELETLKPRDFQTFAFGP